MIANILRIIPSFSFAYGFNQFLSAQLIYYADNKNMAISTSLDDYMNRLEYVGMDYLYMSVEFFVYIAILVFYETFKNSCKRKSTSYNNITSSSKINDSIVMQEIEKANSDRDDERYLIKVKNLEKTYRRGLCGGKKKAVNNLSFCLEKGECFALLGVNGAGKTTTFKALTCEHLPTGGDIFINGIELTKHFHKVRNLIGYCPQFDAIFDYMTVNENLEFYANIKGIKKEFISHTVKELISELNLTQYENKISGNLSGGNKRKLSVAIAMIGNPPIILLDEPSTGMDPEARRFMWDIIGQISTRNKSSCVILTTHSMEEAENLCRKIGIMVNGQFKCLGTSQDIKDKYGFGYEMDLRINILPEKVLQDYLRNSNLNPEDSLQDLNAIKNSLSLMKKQKYFILFDNSKLALELNEKINSGSRINNKNLIEWVFYTENFIKSADKILNYFEDVTLIEYFNNSFKLKIKKNSNSRENPTNGFLFSYLEEIKKYCNISEYSINQSSLEQIFNKFAMEIGEEVLQRNSKKEMKLTKEFVTDLLK